MAGTQRIYPDTPETALRTSPDRGPRGSLLRALPAVVAAFLCALGAPTAHAHPDRARYLGNEGVLVSSGDVRVLFDALYADSYGQYVLVSAQTRAAMMAGREPFDGVAALFVSHVHGDHFTAAPTLAYLRAQPEVVLYGASQVTSRIRALVPEDDPVLTRLHSVDLRPGDAPVRIRVGELLIEAVAIPHAGGARTADVDNLMFRVTLADHLTVSHLGDADADDRHFAPIDDFLAERRVHAAFPPYWFLGSTRGRAIIEDRLRADQTIGIHVPAAARGHGDAWRQRAGGDLFTDPGETRELQGDGETPP